MPLTPTAYQVHLVIDLSKIDTVARTKIQNQFIDSLSDWIELAEVPFFHAIDSIYDPRPRLEIKGIEPLAQSLVPKLILANNDLTREDFHTNTRRRLRVK